MDKTMLPAQPNQSLIDGLSCLQALAVRNAPSGVRELARELGLEPTRVSRLLGTLAHLGMAEKTPSRKYQPGPGMHVLFAQALQGSRLLQKAWPVLRSLADEDLTVSLGVLWRDKVCYLYHGKPERAFEEGIFHLDVFPSLQSSIGRVLLAVGGHPAPRGLAKDFAAIRGQGFCQIDRGGGERSLAVPISKPPHAALALSGKIPATRIAALITRLQTAAATIDENL
jgi:DNA-binding IclR family transcriptional regulator